MELTGFAQVKHTFKDKDMSLTDYQRYATELFQSRMDLIEAANGNEAEEEEVAEDPLVVRNGTSWKVQDISLATSDDGWPSLPLDLSKAYDDYAAKKRPAKFYAKLLRIYMTMCYCECDSPLNAQHRIQLTE